MTLHWDDEDVGSRGTRISVALEDALAGRVGLEVDGDEFHRDRFQEDRRKDLLITLAGMHSIRPTTSMVLYEWELVMAAIEEALRAVGERRLFGNAATAR